MISKQELLQLRAEWQLDVGVIEKDHVLGWLLAAISVEPELSWTWIFKGGTCLRNCYYETYRFSEDLDFTVIDGGPVGAAQLTEIFRRVSAWLSQESGLDLIVEDGCFAERRNLWDNPTAQARIPYRGPNPQPTLPKINSISPGMRRLWRRWRCVKSSIPTETRHSQRMACSATRSLSLRPALRNMAPGFEPV